MTTIVDYGAGNIRSVENTLEELNAPHVVTSDSFAVEQAARIMLPGVGHFGQMMQALDDLGLREPLVRKIRSGTPFLGICVGLQCLFAGSEEAPGSAGLGILPGLVKRFRGPLRVPHMGWNSLHRVKPSRLLFGLGDSPYTYFAHSYFAPVIDSTAAICTYLETYTAVLEQDGLYGVQFHPEKSGSIGLHVLKNFLAL
jgi:imidazole glycerol-phosphate synthase subunit HisH